MNCARRQERIWLYSLGELEPAEADELRHHLERCEDCRAELERHRLFLQAVESARLVPQPELLAACRRELGAALHARKGSGEWRRRLLKLLPGRQPGRLLWARLAAAAALVLAGFLAGRFSSGPEQVWPFRPDARGVRVRYIEQAPSGDVRLHVEEFRKKVVRGRLSEQGVRRLLIEAVRDPYDPAVRADALELLRAVGDTLEVRAVFIEALERDPNPAIRLKAVEGLRAWADDPESRQALSRALLTDNDATVRAMAVELLAASPQPDVVETFQALLGRERDSHIRERSASILKAMNASPGIF